MAGSLKNEEETLHWRKSFQTLSHIQINCVGQTFKSGNLMANKAQEDYSKRLGTVIGVKAYV